MARPPRETPVTTPIKPGHPAIRKSFHPPRKYSRAVPRSDTTPVLAGGARSVDLGGSAATGPRYLPWQMKFSTYFETCRHLLRKKWSR